MAQGTRATICCSRRREPLAPASRRQAVAVGGRRSQLRAGGGCPITLCNAVQQQIAGREPQGWRSCGCLAASLQGARLPDGVSPR